MVYLAVIMQIRKLTAASRARFIKLGALGWAVFCLLATACIPTAMPAPSPTPTLAPATQSPTPTIVWFPPTPTPTPFASPTSLPPTPEQRPGIGDVMFIDNFARADGWMLVEKDCGSARLGKNELTIAISKQRVYIFSLRQELQLTNFYAEITANPSLCRGLDEYGLLMRVMSPGDYYRFSVSCDGQVRLDRIFQSQASSPQPWLLSGSIPIGGPSTSRLGVWAVGPEMRFFINGEFQFSIKDGAIPVGTLGVFARSASDEALTVNFLDLTVWEVNP